MTSHLGLFYELILRRKIVSQFKGYSLQDQKKKMK
jgi:hypothetical protein